MCKGESVRLCESIEVVGVRMLKSVVLSRSIEKYINAGYSGWSDRYYKMLLDVESVSDSELFDVCANYIELRIVVI